jgi:Autophagocytosis associated protein, active-site domain
VGCAGAALDSVWGMQASMPACFSTQVANGKPFPVNHYLLLFLKFIAGVVPTIEYDYTMGYDMS